MPIIQRCYECLKLGYYIMNATLVFLFTMVLILGLLPWAMTLSRAVNAQIKTQILVIANYITSIMPSDPADSQPEIVFLQHLGELTRRFVAAAFPGFHVLLNGQMLAESPSHASTGDEEEESLVDSGLVSSSLDGGSLALPEVAAPASSEPLPAEPIPDHDAERITLDDSTPAAEIAPVDQMPFLNVPILPGDVEQHAPSDSSSAAEFLALQCSPHSHVVSLPVEDMKLEYVPSHSISATEVVPPIELPLLGVAVDAVEQRVLGDSSSTIKVVPLQYLPRSQTVPLPAVDIEFKYVSSDSALTDTNDVPSLELPTPPLSPLNMQGEAGDTSAGSGPATEFASPLLSPLSAQGRAEEMEHIISGDSIPSTTRSTSATVDVTEDTSMVIGIEPSIDVSADQGPLLMRGTSPAIPLVSQPEQTFTTSFHDLYQFLISEGIGAGKDQLLMGLTSGNIEDTNKAYVEMCSTLEKANVRGELHLVDKITIKLPRNIFRLPSIGCLVPCPSIVVPNLRDFDWEGSLSLLPTSWSSILDVPLHQLTHMTLNGCKLSLSDCHVILSKCNDLEVFSVSKLGAIQSELKPEPRKVGCPRLQTLNISADVDVKSFLDLLEFNQEALRSVTLSLQDWNTMAAIATSLPESVDVCIDTVLPYTTMQYIYQALLPKQQRLVYRGVTYNSRGERGSQNRRNR